MRITVFTPTYNRAYIIENLYKSLQRQTFKDFEWVIVDDGSTDDTETVISKWQHEENDFSIRYYWKENGGKCRAINYALDLAQGELFFTVDSDDYLTDDALEKILSWVEQLPIDNTYCGVAGNIGLSAKSTSNTLFDNGYYEGTLLERYSDIDGERALVFFTDVHKKYLYPEFENEKFMTEAVVYNRMAHDGYKMRFYNDIIWVYEYLEDGLTKAGNELFLSNPRGYGLWLREKAEFQRISFKEKLMMQYTFCCDVHSRVSADLIAECMAISKVRVMFFLIIHKMICRLKRK